MVNVLSLCFSALFLSNLALAGASNSRPRRLHNSHAEAVQKRAAEDHHAAVLAAAHSGSTLAVAMARKRAVGRCHRGTSTTSITTTSTSTTSMDKATTHLVGNPGGDPTTTTTTSTTPTYTHRHHKTTLATTSAPPATTSSGGGHGGSGGGGGGSGDTFGGQGTYYGTGLGACGWTNKDTDYIAAASELLYDTWPGANSGNPNDNPICGRYATAHYGGNSVRVKIVDRCVACKKYDLDFSPAAFSQLADQSLGRIDITWSWS